MGKPVQQCMMIIKNAQSQIHQLLEGTDHVNNILEIDNLFRRLEFRFQSMGAVTEHEVITKKNDPFPPITSWMGEELKVDKTISRADINPEEADRVAYLKKVEALYTMMPEMTVDQVLNSYTLEDHVLVVRGVAKRAGVKDFDTREMNVPFIEDILLAIELKNEEKSGQDKIDKELSTQKTKTILTQEMIDADPDLVKWKAVPGDEMVIRERDGKKSLVKQKQKAAPAAK